MLKQGRVLDLRSSRSVFTRMLIGFRNFRDIPDLGFG